MDRLQRYSHRGHIYRQTTIHTLRSHCQEWTINLIMCDSGRKPGDVEKTHSQGRRPHPLLSLLLFHILFINIWSCFTCVSNVGFWFKILQRKCLYTRLYCVEKSHKKNTPNCHHIFYFTHPLVATCAATPRVPAPHFGNPWMTWSPTGPWFVLLLLLCGVSPSALLFCSIKPGHIKHSYSCKPGKLRAWLFLIDSSGWSRKHEAVLNLYSRLVSCRQTDTVVWGFLRVIFEVILMVWYCYGWYCQPNICTLQYIHISNIYKHI